MHAGWSRDDGRSVDQDGLSNNDNMETEEAQEDQHLADRLNRMTTNTSEIKSVSTGSKLF